MKGNITQEQLQASRELIGEWLANHRKNNGLSQQELADKLGVDQGTVSKVEQGKWAITVDMLALFCHHLDYPIKKLFK